MANKTIEGVTALTTSAASEAGRFINKQAFQQFSFWGKLKEREKSEFYEEGKQLAAAMIAHGSSKLAIGAHLANIQKILTPYEAFGKFLKQFRFTEKTAYRYITGYNNASSRFSEPILRAAMARGMEIFGYTEETPLGRYTAAFKKLDATPPKNPDPATANRYLDELEKTRRQYVQHRTQLRLQGKVLTEEEVERDPRVMLQQAFRVAKNAIGHLPKRKRRPFLDSLTGMLMTQIGIGSATSFSPEAIPDSFRQGRGRPQLMPTLEGKQEQRSA